MNQNIMRKLRTKYQIIELEDLDEKLAKWGNEISTSLETDTFIPRSCNDRNQVRKISHINPPSNPSCMPFTIYKPKRFDFVKIFLTNYEAINQRTVDGITL